MKRTLTLLTPTLFTLTILATLVALSLTLPISEPYGCPYGTQGDWCNSCQYAGCNGQWQCETGQQRCTHDPLFGDSCTNLWGDCQDLPVCPRDRVNMKNCGGIVRCCNDGQSCEDCVRTS